MEVFLTFAFIYWFFKKGQEFKQEINWRPIANVKTLTPRLSSGSQDTDYSYSRQEIVLIFKNNNLSSLRCKRFLKLVGMESLESSVTITHSRLKKLLLDQKGITLNQVPFNESTFKEGLYAMMFSSRCEAGKYYYTDPTKDVDYPWGSHFNKFTPNHMNYYFVNLFRMFVVLLILNFLIFYPITQVSLSSSFLSKPHLLFYLYRYSYYLLSLSFIP